MELQMRQLFKIYYEQCSHEIIQYTAQTDSQCWIVMDGIELSYMNYQGEPQPIFMCNRWTSAYGDNTYYFKNYDECKRVWQMTEQEVVKYDESIRIIFNDVDGNKIKVGDRAVIIDVEDYDGELERGKIVFVSKLLELDSNYIECTSESGEIFGMFGHRILKIK